MAKLQLVVSPQDYLIFISLQTLIYWHMFTVPDDEAKLKSSQQNEDLSFCLLSNTIII
jgi:hypothetical protein